MAEATVKRVCEILKNARYFSKEDMTDRAFMEFSKLKELLRTRPENSPHLLNKGNVTGVWYLTKYAYDEGFPQTILRLDMNKPDMKDNYTQTLLEGEIFDVIHNDINYMYHQEILKGDTMVQGLQALLFSEIESGNVVTIYDKERE